MHEAQAANHLLGLPLAGLLEERLATQIGMDMDDGTERAAVAHPVATALLDIVIREQQRLEIVAEPGPCLGLDAARWGLLTAGNDDGVAVPPTVDAPDGAEPCQVHAFRAAPEPRRPACRCRAGRSGHGTPRQRLPP